MTNEKGYLSVRLNKNILADLDRIAKKQAISKTSVVSLAIQDYVAKIDKKKRGD